MTHLEEPWEACREVVEFFVKEPLQLIRRGSKDVIALRNSLPAAWVDALEGRQALAEALQRLWQPAGPDAQPFLQRLIDQTVDVALAASQSPALPPSLLYLNRRQAQDGPHYFAWFAGLPATSVQVSREAARLGVSIPLSYQRFVSVHNGFNVDGHTMVGPAALERLVRLSDLIDAEPAELGYDPKQVLPFSGDGGGNEQCYHLALPLADGDYLTVDWDHETRELNAPMSLWAYLENLVRVETGL